MLLQWDRPTLAGGSPETVSVEVADGRADLEFAPADPAAATTLTGDQVAAFNRDGFLRPFPVLGPDEVGAVADYVDGLVRRVTEGAGHRNEFSLINYQGVCPGLYDLVTDDRILDRVADLLGPDLVCWGSHVFHKTPGLGMSVPFHQDAIFWPLTPLRSVTVWLAVDDADADNGAVVFAPGSHLLGALPHTAVVMDGTKSLHKEVGDGARFEPGLVTNELAAGQASVHSDLLVHGSAANRSRRRRSGLAIRYVAADVRVVAGAEWYVSWSIHCRGSVPGHWRHTRRPRRDHPELMAGVHGQFDGQPVDRRATP